MRSSTGTSGTSLQDAEAPAGRRLLGIACRATDVECPYCRGAMRPGWVTTRGIALEPLFVSVNWISNDGPREGSVVLAPRGLRRPKRDASCCPECEAIVIEPKPVQ
jgi:hypothetical protein